jgi:hypothetical protein
MADLVRSFRDRGMIRAADGGWDLAQLPDAFAAEIPASFAA